MYGRWSVACLYYTRRTTVFSTAVLLYTHEHKCVIITEPMMTLFGWVDSAGHWSCYSLVLIIALPVYKDDIEAEQLHKCLQVQRRCLWLACWWCSWPLGAFHSAGLKPTTDVNSPAIYSTNTNCRPIKSLSVRIYTTLVVLIFCFLFTKHWKAVVGVQHSLIIHVKWFLRLIFMDLQRQTKKIGGALYRESKSAAWFLFYTESNELTI